MNGYWVYIIGPESGWPVKVGYSSNLVTRLGKLQEGCYEKLRLQKKYYVPNKSAAIRMERMAHKNLDQFSIMSGKRIKGEWFNVFVDDAIKAVDDAFNYQKKLEALKDNGELSEDKLSFYGYIDIQG